METKKLAPQSNFLDAANSFVFQLQLHPITALRERDIPLQLSIKKCTFL